MNNSGSRYGDIEVCRCVRSFFPKYFWSVFFPAACDVHRSECSSLGGSLASIHTREENDFVFNLIQPHGVRLTLTTDIMDLLGWVPVVSKDDALLGNMKTGTQVI